MAKNKKRTKYVTELINKVNETLRFRKIQDESDTLFVFACDYLLKKNMYQGYNFYKDEFNPYLNKIIPTLAGSYKKDKFEYLQIN